MTTIPQSPGPVIGSLCTGYGGLDLGLLAALGGGRIAWCADPDPHITQILAARLPGVPNLGDIRTVDWTTVEPVEILTAGFPCQDISAAGKRLGIENGARSGVWTDIVAALRLLRPTLLIVENVAALRWKNGGLHRVLSDLAETGYDAAWRSVRASDIGAAHRRERVFLLAWPTTANTSRDSAQRIRASRPMARPTRTAAGPQDQRQRNGHAALNRGPTPTDADCLGRQELHPRRPDRRPVTSPRSPATAHTPGLRHRNLRTTSGHWLPTAAVPTGPAAGGRLSFAADTTGDRRHQGIAGAAGLDRRPDAALGSHDRGDRRTVDWGTYAPAIRRWEEILGRPTPYPTEHGRHGRPVLAPAFVEHLMGLPPGWVTDLPLPRTAQLRALGNGVVPHQAAHAITALLGDLAELLDEEASAA
jgi:DNA (cytosine-5)-methyltransferase 1